MNEGKAERRVGSGVSITAAPLPVEGSGAGVIRSAFTVTDRNTAPRATGGAMRKRPVVELPETGAVCRTTIRRKVAFWSFRLSSSFNVTVSWDQAVGAAEPP
jgi:hypothetical protein